MKKNIVIIIIFILFCLNFSIVNSEIFIKAKINDRILTNYDVKNEKYGDLLRLGIIDPMKVTKNALQNAISVATTLLSTNAIITLARSIDYQEKTSDPKNWKIKDIK